MFKFLKNKIKDVVSSFSKKVDKEAKEEVVEEVKEDVTKEYSLEVNPAIKEKEKKLPKKKSPAKKLVEKSESVKEEKQEEVVQELTLSIEEKSATKVTDAPSEKKGFFRKLTEKITTKKIDEKLFESLFWDLELVLLEHSVAMEVIEKIKEDLKRSLIDKPLARSKLEAVVLSSLKSSIESLFSVQKVDLLSVAKKKFPLIICLVGINGSGKTTTIAKLARFFQNAGKSVVLAASDTFRAAAIDQLQIHADNLGVRLVRHEYGADAAAVAFDAIAHAKARGVDVVLIDTAGRLHSNTNLVDEMKKIVRVAKPDLKIFIGESITGNDCVEQAQKFDEAISFDGIILSKADIDEKGGAAISISYVTKKPILFLGVGQEYDDLEVFDAKKLVERLFG